MADEKRSTVRVAAYSWNTLLRQATVHFRCDRVSQTRVVRYQSNDTAETVTLYIDICLCNVLVFPGFVATIDEKRISDYSTRTLLAVVTEKLHFRCYRVSQTRVVRFQSKDTAENVTLYIDICVALFWVLGFGRMLVYWFPPILRSKIAFLYQNVSYRFAASDDCCAKTIGSMFITLYS